MPVVVRILTIRVPLEAVWAVAAEGDGLPWRAGAGIETEAVEPPRHVRLGRLGVPHGGGDIWLEPLPGGRSTRVTWREELALDVRDLGLPAAAERLARWLGPMLRPVFELAVRADLRRLAHAAEQSFQAADVQLPRAATLGHRGGRSPGPTAEERSSRSY